MGLNTLPRLFDILCPGIALNILPHQRGFSERIRLLEQAFDEISSSAQPLVISDVSAQQKLCARTAETKVDNGTRNPLVRIWQWAPPRLSQNSAARASESQHRASLGRILVSVGLEVAAHRCEMP